MVILARIPVRPANLEGGTAPLRSVPEIQCCRGDEQELLLHAALLQRLGFDSPKIRRLLESRKTLQGTETIRKPRTSPRRPK